MRWVDELRAMDACEDAVEWAGTQPSLAQAWRRCKRGDWMLWLAGRRRVPRERLVWIACQCARLSLKYVPLGEDRPRIAIETAEAWTRGEAGLNQVLDAASASYAAYADAAYAAAYAASAAAYADAAAADAAADAAYYADDADAARAQNPT